MYHRFKTLQEVYNMIELLSFQKDVLKALEPFKRCAVYYGLGLGKTYIDSEKLMSYKAQLALICQRVKD